MTMPSVEGRARQFRQPSQAEQIAALRTNAELRGPSGALARAEANAARERAATEAMAQRRAEDAARAAQARRQQLREWLHAFAAVGGGALIVIMAVML